MGCSSSTDYCDDCARAFTPEKQQKWFASLFKEFIERNAHHDPEQGEDRLKSEVQKLKSTDPDMLKGAVDYLTQKAQENDVHAKKALSIIKQMKVM